MHFSLYQINVQFSESKILRFLLVIKLLQAVERKKEFYTYWVNF